MSDEFRINNHSVEMFLLYIYIIYIKYIYLYFIYIYIDAV